MLESTNHVILLLRLLPPQLEGLKQRLDTFSYTILNINSPEFKDLNLVLPPRVALIPIDSRVTLNSLVKEIAMYNKIFPESGTRVIGIYSGGLRISAVQLERIGINAIFQSPFEDESLINAIFETAPISAEHKNLTFDQLIRINIVDFENAHVLPYDVFLYLPMNQRAILYLPKDSVLDKKTVDKIRKSDRHNLYIKRHDLGLYREHSREQLTMFDEDVRLTEVERSQKVAFRLAGLMDGFFSGDDYSEDDGHQLLDNLKSFVKDLTGPGGTKAGASLKRFASDRLTTASHNQNVSAYCALFGLTLGLTDAESLRLGGLLHDVGKSELSGEGATQLRLHPITGLSLLIKRNLNISVEVQDMILYHHEHTDGSGYPSGKKGDEIPPYAKVCAFANEFDKLTSIRPGYPQLSPAEAFRRIAGLDGDLPSPIFDPQFHQPLIDKLLPSFTEPTHDLETTMPVTAAKIHPEPEKTEGLIDYGKVKNKSGMIQKHGQADRIVSLARLLKTEHFYRPKFFPEFKCENPIVQAEVTLISKQLGGHFKKVKGR